jgi:hypothetical protein
MNLTRWLFASIFALAVAAAWQGAQPPASTPTAIQFTSPANPLQNSVSSPNMGKRMIVTTPVPRKISGDLLQ